MQKEFYQSEDDLKAINIVLAGLLAAQAGMSLQAKKLPAGTLTGGMEISDGVSKKTLPNGLTVLVKEVHSAPVVAVNAWVRAGSVDENAREKGITHFIEHMLFKGTEKLAVGELDKKIKQAGGYNNAHTRYESTDFIDVMPSDQFDVALDTMADALMHSTFDATELVSERKVVLEELSRSQDNPGFEAWKALTYMAFEKHPYRDPIIGYREVLEVMEQKDLIHYWKKWYRPSNMVFVVVGDVKADQIHKKIAKAFKNWKSEAVKPTRLPREAAQTKLRLREFGGDIQTTMLVLGVQGPSELHEDAPAMEVALSILGQGLSSRLNQEVREKKKLVHSIHAGQFNGRSPGLCYLFADTEPQKVSEAAKALWQEVLRMQTEAVTDDELKRQLVKLEHEEAAERMSMEGMAGQLGYYETLAGDYKLGDVFTRRMRQVSVFDVKKVMQKYFKPQAANVVVYRNEKNKAVGLDAVAWQNLLANVQLPPAPGLKTAGGSFERFRLANGIQLLVKPIRHAPVVAAQFVFEGGSRHNPRGREGLFNMMARMSLKGTAALNAAQLARRMDDLGAVIRPYSDSDRFGIRMQALSDHLDETLELLAQILRFPAFQEQELNKEKERVLKDIKDKTDSAEAYVQDIFDSVFFKRSPYRWPSEGTAESVARIKRTDLVKLHQKFVVPENLLIVVTGDVDSAVIRRRLNELLGAAAWNSSGLKMPEVAQEKLKPRHEVEKRVLKKKQAHIMLGWPVTAPNAAEYFALRLLNSVMGEGMDSRLFTQVREKRGLCYTVQSWFDRRLDNGAWRIYVGTSPENRQEAIDVSLQVARDLAEKGITQEELKAAKAYAKGIFQVARQDFGTEARILAQYEFLGLGAERIDKYPELIENVTLNEIQAVAKKYLVPEKTVITYVEP